jgi:hypothetical protein
VADDHWISDTHLFSLVPFALLSCRGTHRSRKAATNMKIVAFPAAYDFSPKSLKNTKSLGDYSKEM